MISPMTGRYGKGLEWADARISEQNPCHIEKTIWRGSRRVGGRNIGDLDGDDGKW
jgi:hypothetical protein